MAKKRLYKSNKNKSLCGVCGGVGEYLGMDPTLIRLIFLLIVLCTGLVPGLLAYIVACFIVPDKPKKK